jgi:hypothetical protein
MLLGVPLDYRNEYDLEKAVASFGKLHHSHHKDKILDTTLVFTSFNSPALVPRNVVFGNYTNLGGFKDSWTAPCYVLTVDFSDIIPRDEDQMCANGNPHPLPSNLHHDFNNFVVPQFLELKWNEIIEQHHPLVQDDDFLQAERKLVEQEDQVQHEEEQLDSSIINGSTNFVDVAPGDEEVNQHLVVNSILVCFWDILHPKQSTGLDIIASFMKQDSQLAYGPPCHL